MIHGYSTLPCTSPTPFAVPSAADRCRYCFYRLVEHRVCGHCAGTPHRLVRAAGGCAPCGRGVDDG